MTRSAESFRDKVRDDDADVRAAMREFTADAVYQAAKKQVGESVEQPLRYYRENVEGLRVLLEAVADAGVPSFVFSSSAAVYGMPDVNLVTEDTPCVPMSPYGETKLAGEWLTRATGRATGLRTACLRYFNVFGPRQDPNGPYAAVIPRFITAMLQGQTPIVYGDGQQIRDWLHTTAAKTLQVSPFRLYKKGTGQDWNVKNDIAVGAVDLNGNAQTIGSLASHPTALGVNGIVNTVDAHISGGSTVKAGGALPQRPDAAPLP